MTRLHEVVAAPTNAKAGSPDLVEVRRLLDEGAEVNALDAHGRTPLDVAAIIGDTTPEHEAASLAVMRLLVERGARATSASTYSPLAHFELLLSAGAPVAARAESGDFLLHEAASGGRPAHARVLLARGAELNAVDGLGRTPLWRAQEELTKPWVAANGRTPGFVELISVLEGAGAKLEVQLPVQDDPFAPLPIDLEKVRALVATVDVGRSIADTLKGRFASMQALVEVLSDHGEMTRPAFYRAIAPAFPLRDVTLQGDTVLKRPFFVNGDLVVEGHLKVRNALAVTGSVRVRGVLTDGGNDSLVSIGGDLWCAGLYSDGDFAVGGALTAEVVIGYYNDFTLEARTLRAVLAIEDDHATAADIKAGLHFDLDGYRGEGVTERLEALLVDEVCEGDGGVLNREVFNVLRRNGSLYRWPRAHPASSEDVVEALLWFASRLEAPVNAAPFVAAIARRELRVEPEALAVAIDWALSQPALSWPDGKHEDAVLRAFLAAIAR